MLLPKTILILQAAIFGLLIGSFLNVCIYRIPKGMTLWGRSYCPKCGALIKWYNNIPILSYLFQGAKGSCCKEPISSQYPAIEALTCILSVATMKYVATQGYPYPLANYFAWFLLFIAPLIVLSMIDFQLQILPDVITLPGIVIGIFVRILEDYPNYVTALKTSGLGILIGGGSLLLIGEIFSRIKKVDAMGGGDIKLAAMLGAFLGWKALIFIFFASSVLALVYVVLLTLFRKYEKGATIPFGPFLSMGGMIFYLYGKKITDWYFDMYHIPGNWFFS